MRLFHIEIMGWSWDLWKTSGRKRFFRGRNKYGAWAGWNIIPGRFGLMIEWD